MSKAFRSILDKIGSLEHQILYHNAAMNIDLFTKNQDLDILRFLHPKNISGFIKPLSLASSQPIKIYTQEAEPPTIYYTISPTSYGDLIIASTDLGICFVSFYSKNSIKNLHANYPNSTHKNVKTHLHEIAINYLENNPVTSLSLHIKGTAFQLQVWESLLHIPQGQLSTYKHIAIAINNPNASIAVGAAVGKNPIALLIPCPRVIRGSGVWRGYKWGNKHKAALLAFELM